MKKLHVSVKLLFVACILLALTITACQKSNLKEQPQTSSAPKISKEVAVKNIVAYVALQQNRATGYRADNIKKLQQALEISALRFEPYKGKEQFAVIPVSASNFTGGRTAATSNSKKYLVTVLDEQGQVVKANVIAYSPKAGEPAELPANTFFKIFTYKDIERNGQFDVHSLSGKKYYSLTFEGGKRNAVMEYKAKEKSKINTRTEGCIDWYLITTVTYADGSQTTTEEYVGSSGNCGGAGGWTGCNDPNMQSICPDDGTGRQDTDYIDYEYEYVAKADFDWYVQEIPSAFGGGYINQLVEFWGRFNNKRPEKDRFTALTLVNRSIQSSQWGQNGTVAWGNMTNNRVLLDKQVTLSTSGTLRFLSNGVEIEYQGARTVRIGELWWR